MSSIHWQRRFPGASPSSSPSNTRTTAAAHFLRLISSSQAASPLHSSPRRGEVTPRSAWGVVASPVPSFPQTSRRSRASLRHLRAETVNSACGRAGGSSSASQQLSRGSRVAVAWWSGVLRRVPGAGAPVSVSAGLHQPRFQAGYCWARARVASSEWSGLLITGPRVAKLRRGRPAAALGLTATFFSFFLFFSYQGLRFLT